MASSEGVRIREEDEKEAGEGEGRGVPVKAVQKRRPKNSRHVMLKSRRSLEAVPEQRAGTR